MSRRRWMNKVVRRGHAAALSLVLAVTSPAGGVTLMTLVLAVMSPARCVTAQARSPEFARTPEEWARLRDDVLEYEEIEDLIAEYNVTVQNNYEDWKKNDSGKALEDYIEDSERALDDLYDTSDSADELTMIATDYSARMQEIQIQNTIDGAEDATTKKWEIDKIEKSLVAQAQNGMNNYYQLQYQLESARKSRQLMETLLANTQRQFAQTVGMATYSDVLTAQQNLQNTDAQIITLTNQMETARQNLIVMMGWKQDAQPEIRPMPALDVSRIETMDPTADLETACANDYELLAEQRKLDNSITANGQLTHGNNVENIRQQIAVALNSAYQSVLLAKSAYDQSSLTLDIANRNYQSATVRQQAGTGTAMETLQAEVSLVSAQSDREVKGLQLFAAMETYDWVLRGVRS